MTVANSGTVIPPHEVDSLIQPFQRLAVERAGGGDGHGLGLSIVDAITAAHHGALQLHAPPDGGLHIETTLPGPPATPKSQRPAYSQKPPALIGTHTQD